MLRYALLGLLDAEPMSGYELAKTVDTTVGFFWHATHSQIYPELRRLEEEGLLRGKRVRQTDKPDKRVYRTTAKGKQALRDWAATAIPTQGHREPLVLRVFNIGHTFPETAIPLLEERRKGHAARLALYEKVRELWDARGLVPGGAWTTEVGQPLAIEAGIRFERMWIDWIDWTIEQVSKSMEQAG